MTGAWFLAQLTAQQRAEIENYTLHPSGWIVMILSIGFVAGLLAWCIRRVMRESRPQKLHGQIDVDTQDVEP